MNSSGKKLIEGRYEFKRQEVDRREVKEKVELKAQNILLRCTTRWSRATPVGWS
jgi:hypothetical protein